MTGRTGWIAAWVALCLVAGAAELPLPVTDAEMQAVYDEVKTPCKYGVVLAPDKAKGEMFDNPMVFRHGDAWYMMFIRFDGKGYETHLAKSDDLLEWTRLGCIFRRGAKGTWDSAQADGWPALVDMDWNGSNRLNTFDGRYWMMYLGGSAEGYETDPLSTGVAWTDDPSAVREWTRFADNPVLSPLDADARPFERKTIYKHYTVEDPSRRLGARFVNYYNAKQQGEWTERIGMAVSDDMLHWRRYGDGPAVCNTGALDHGICGDPMVRKIGDLYVMFYFGFRWENRGGTAFDTFAVSKDLVNWRPWRGAKLIEASEPWDRQHAHKPWVIKHDGVVYHYYCAVGDQGRALALATSKPVASVKRIPQPPRNVRGSTGISRQGPCDAAAWVWAKDAPLPAGGEFLRFRKAFTSDGTPLRLHVSADERFVLLLDGKTVARGPDRGDIDLWFAQSLEAKMPRGEHLLEAVCWRMAEHHSPNAQKHWRGGFVLKAEGAYDRQLTTGTAAWQVARLTGTRMTRDKYPTGPVGAQCEVVGTGLLDERPRDAAYAPVATVRGPLPEVGHSTRVPGWLVYPTELPAQMARTVRPGAFRAADGQAFATNGVWNAQARDWCSNGWWRASAATNPAVARANALLARGEKLVVPARTKLRLLWDLGEYYCAYNALKVSGGKDAKIAWGWAESLYTGDCFDWHTVVTDRERKGPTSRAKWDDKYFYGFADVFRPDGRAGAVFTAPWWRCGRWCQLEVETADAPLTLDGVELTETRYPFEPEGYFDCSDPTVAGVRKMCLRGLQMCMHEMHFDCPYYEQQMYGGDTRIQMLTVAALSRDARLTRQGFRLFEISQRDNGLVSMNYPTSWLQESSTFTFYWTLMLGDYARWHDDPAWVRARMPAVRKWLFNVEAHVGSDGLLRDLPGWSFIDWVPEWDTGMAPGGGRGKGVSSVNNLLYLLALRRAAEVERTLGEDGLAARWERKADALAAAAEKAFWDDARGLVADTPERKSFSEHAQCFAILARALPKAREDRAFAGLISAPDLARCTVSFSHYLFATLAEKGRTDLLLKRLDLWRDMVKQDLKTPLEGPGDSRSDCHGWGAHPLYHLQTGVAGIRPAAAGFKSVRVAPQPGGRAWIRAGVPAPTGLVEEDLRFDGDRVAGTVTLPEGLAGVFEWKGRTQPLGPGVNEVR